LTKHSPFPPTWRCLNQCHLMTNEWGVCTLLGTIGRYSKLHEFGPSMRLQTFGDHHQGSSLDPTLLLLFYSLHGVYSFAPAHAPHPMCATPHVQILQSHFIMDGTSITRNQKQH
jgi:hypothetical protein